MIHLPHISNFTDFNALEHYDGVSLRYVDRPAHLGQPDLILLPGTKNTMADLKWLRESGLEAMIWRLVEEQKVPVIGICGGYQMLGEQLSDPHGVEGEPGSTMPGHGTSGGRDHLCGRENQNPDRRNGDGSSWSLWPGDRAEREGV